MYGKKTGIPGRGNSTGDGPEVERTGLEYFKTSQEADVEPEEARSHHVRPRRASLELWL